MNYISKLRNIVFLLTATTVLTACETAAQLSNIITSDKSAYSCEQIYGAFKAYDADKQSTNALMQLSGMVNVDGLEDGTAQVENPSNYYQRTKMAANVALITQGCQPLG